MNQGSKGFEGGINRGLSRRDAIKGAAVAGFGLLGASALAACSPGSGSSGDTA